MPHDTLFDAARGQNRKTALEVPLWTGLRLHAMPLMSGKSGDAFYAQISHHKLPLPLKEIETLILKAVDEARATYTKPQKASA